MNNDAISGIIDKLTGIESIYSDIIKRYRAETGCKIIMSPFFFVPPEINSAFNIITLKIPEFILDKPGRDEILKSLCDAVVIPGEDTPCGEGFMPGAYTFNMPSGYGEDAAVNLHNEILSMLKTLFGIDLKTISIEKLQQKTEVYERLRRTVRSISSVRNENTGLLKNSALSAIFEAALILPPEIALEFILPLIDELKKAGKHAEKKYLSALIYGGRQIPAAVLDGIEQAGILIAEDDTCSGRRPFDISLNAGSEYIFYELLDAYSYRALTPCTRGAHERYELLYRLLKNYGIEAVIFFKDGECRHTSGQIDYLRKRLMRDGIDPVIINSENYRSIIDDYLKIAL